MIDHESDRLLSQMLDELGSADPPPDFTRNIIWGITNNRVTIHRTQTLSDRKGIDMTRKAMWGLAAAAAILLAIFVVRGFPPAGQGTEGTIGAAQRYQAPQIADNDVVLGDAEVQEFLQSDTFERAIADPDVRALLADARGSAALREADFRRALLEADARAALTNPDLHRLFSNAGARRALESPDLRRAFEAELRKAQADLKAGPVELAALSESNARALSHKAVEAALRAAVETAAAKKMVDDASLRQLVEDSSARVALADVGARKAIENAAVRKALGDDALRALMARPNMAAALGNRAFLDAVGHEAFGAALISRPRQNQ